MTRLILEWLAVGLAFVLGCLWAGGGRGALRLEVVERLNGEVWLYDSDDDAPICKFVQGREENLRVARYIAGASPSAAVVGA